MKSDRIKGEIDALRKRETDIAAELEEARQALRNGREAVVTGKGSTSDLTTLQARVTALEGAAEAVVDRITEKRTELAEATESERVRDVRTQMSGCRTEASALIEELAEKRTELSAAYDAALETFRRKGGELDATIRRFRELAASIAADEDITVPPDPAWHSHPVALTVTRQLESEAYRERSSRGYERMLKAETA
jgi:chromosome segregation ATPase